MYCVIQKIENKKVKSLGASREIQVHYTTFTMENRTNTIYGYDYSNDRFERNIRTAYRISIHKSYRENKKIKKMQWVICTIAYYDMADLSTWIGDYIIKSELDEKLQDMGITEDELCKIVYDKLDPIIATVKKEYEATEEFKTKKKHDAILKKHRESKEKFDKKYGTGEYEQCYDIFGKLRNEEHLKELKARYKAQQEYQRSYYENYKNNYNDYNFSGYSVSKSNTYTDAEKEYLKTIYKAAALKLHPDIKKDNGEGMKFLNKLKDEWNI